MVSAMLLVTSLATAGLKRGLIRFIGPAGPGGRRLVVQVYAAGVVLSVIFGVVFLMGVGGLVDHLPALRHGVVGPLILLVAVGTWAVFVLQDSALIGGRRAAAVPASNAVFSVVKILALGLFLFTPIDQGWAVLLSWIAPGLLIVVLVNYWALNGGLRLQATRSSTDPPTVAAVLRFTSAEYVSAFFWQGAVYLTPLLVLARLGATKNAHFYLAFQIGFALFLISSNITDALVADAADSATHLAAKVWRVSAQMAALMIPAVAILLVAAPQIMGLFGPGYRSDGATVLRLISLAGALNAVTTVLVAVAHVRRHLSLVVILHVLMAVVTIGLAALLASSRGLRGVAEAWLIAQLVGVTVGAVLTAHAEWRNLHAGRRALVSLVAEARKRASALVTRQRVGGLLAALPPQLRTGGPVRLLAHQHDLTVLGIANDDAPVVARVATGEAGRAVIAAHALSLLGVQADTRLAAVRHLVPRVVNRNADNNWLVETARPGMMLGQVHDFLRTPALHGALSALESLHAATEELIFVGPEELAAWVHRPVATVATVVKHATAVEGLAVLHERLIDELADRPVTIACCHGDASLANVLVDEDGAVTGLIDWESSTKGIPEIDPFTLLLSRRVDWEGEELGDVVVDILRNGWRADEISLLEHAPSRNNHLRPTTILVLAWLAHVCANLDKTSRYRANRWWLQHNVERVLTGIVQEADRLPALQPDVARSVAALDVSPAPPSVEHSAMPSGPGPFAKWIDRRRLAVLCGSATGLAALAVWFGAPLVLRIPLVMGSLVIAPAAVIGRRLSAIRPSSRRVLGTAMALSTDVLLAEVLLYAHLWSPGLLLALVGAGTVVAAAKREEVADHVPLGN